jgi:phosphatidylserine/phosphatidylglycerophosphate/cardiolipin synthase-like enzyme
MRKARSTGRAFLDAVAAPVIEALKDRLAAGVDVRIAYDAGKPNVPFQRASADPAPPGTASFIRQLGSGIPAKAITGGDPQLPKLMHHKYVIRDGKTPRGAVWTGSTNFTDDSWTYQENNIVHIESASLCAYFETDFEELWSRSDIATTGEGDTGTVQVEGNRVDVAFAPGEGRSIDHEIAHWIATARRRLKICSMLITSGAILGAFADIVIVDDTVITGSYNLSHSATENAENVLFLHSAALADKYSAYVDRLVKRYGTASSGKRKPQQVV